MEARVTDLPRGFAEAMTAVERRAYDSLSYTHRKEYVLWIEDAKRLEARSRRIEKARAMLRRKGRST
ncbi:MAG TPA: YdeI/OmpD-associated family protein [Candidatus Binatia bacterium]|nr:YdeI/OmpD-associated family protein [Candidatus Binatia bacterium]